MDHAIEYASLHPQAPGRAALAQTPPLPLGPFYPMGAGRGASSALWHGGKLPAGARRLRLRGRVVAVGGAAVAGAEVELWQADGAGRYRHPSAPENERVHSSFDGYGRVRCGADGRFAFDTLLPGGYEEASARRAPHLHVQVSGCFDRLVTQVFLPGHPANELDRWYRASSNPAALTASLCADGPQQVEIEWTAVLRRG
ncbi:MAG: hypothetical protein U1E90_17695 [Burkholderiaceae bacterium]